MSKPTVLYIEDDPDAADATTRLLERNGLVVQVGSSAKRGLELADELQPDLILLDISLPDMNGYEVCQKLRRRSATPIIFLTGNNSVLEIQKGLQAGGNDYITKPYSVKDLVERIFARLSQSQPESDEMDEPDELEQPEVDVLIIAPRADDVVSGIVERLNLSMRLVDSAMFDDKTIPELFAMMYYAQLIICDCSDNAPGAFYAQGASHALGKEVIVLSADDEAFPDVLRRENYLSYNDSEQGMAAFARGLESMIRGVLKL